MGAFLFGGKKMIKASDLYEIKTETVSKSDYSVTFAHYIRLKGTDEWQYVGTVQHFASGDIELVDDGL
jgi:hypothetical protein